MEEDSVYLVWWLPYDSDGTVLDGYDYSDCSLIGVYSSRPKAEEAIERSRKLPGFCDLPDAFLIDSYVVDEDHWTSGFTFR